MPHTEGDIPKSDLSQDTVKGVTRTMRTAQVEIIHERIKAEEVLRKFARNYANDHFQLEHGNTGNDNETIGQFLRSLRRDDPNHEVPYASTYRLDDPHIVSLTNAEIDVLDNKNEPKHLGVLINTFPNFSNPNKIVISADAKLIGLGDNAYEYSRRNVTYYDGSPKRIRYGKIRGEIKRTLSKFARENHLKKTPEAVRRTLRNRIATVGAVAGAVTTGVKYGQDILQFAQHLFTNSPKLPLLP